MHNTLTIVIPNRNRNLATVKRSLDSLATQLTSEVAVTVVDYGSAVDYQERLHELVNTYTGIDLMLCPTQGQLWNKSRCINMVLKNCETTHFMVCDMDMLWNPDFFKIHLNQLSQDHAVYFTVGVMTQQESALQKNFHDYAVKFNTNSEATGITLFPTALLKSINGFDEFYHGWGSEDTDVHMRLKNAGVEVRFRESEVYFKHQWHEKKYRSRSSTLPFHPGLEHINYQYFLMNKSLGKVKANNQFLWGLSCDRVAYKKLEHPTQHLKLKATKESLHAMPHVFKDIEKETVIQVEITLDSDAKTLKTQLKKALGKKTLGFMSLEDVNQHLLEYIVLNHRNCPYSYVLNHETGVILLCILINKSS